MSPNQDFSELLSERVVTVTGGTGTFGSVAVRRFLAAGASEVRVLSRDEKKQDEMRRTLNDTRLRCFLGDVRDRDSLLEPLEGAHFLFHAAALKQVPSCEFYPVEAVRTNVLGTENALSVAQDVGVERAVVLSTDKAAYPINAMGMSKALMEKVAVARSRRHNSATVITTTRYGNVLGSRGSVIPLFVSQIMRNEPLTMTHPSMTRFFMNVDDAIELVLFAMSNGHSGDLFVHKASAGTISDLADACQSLFPHFQAGIRNIGIRHGEKMYETLLTKEEMDRAEDLGRFFRVSSDARDLNYDQFFSHGDPELHRAEEFNSLNARQLTTGEIADLLRGLPVVMEALSD